MVYTPDATKDFSSGDVARRLGCQSLLSVLEVSLRSRHPRCTNNSDSHVPLN